VLRYPIPLDEEHDTPDPYVLNFLWCMHPAAEYSSDDLSRLKKQYNGEQTRFSHFNLVVDWSFSDEAIRRNLDGIVKEIINQRSQESIFPDKYRDSETFQESLRVFDMRESGASWREIGNELWGTKGHGFEKLKNDAIARSRSINKLIKIFEDEAERRISVPRMVNHHPETFTTGSTTL
jgi:hypothetical protein